MNTKNSKKSLKREIWDWVKTILFALILALILRGFVFESVVVDGHSMDNTLATGEKLVLNKLGNYFSDPEYGDIIVIREAYGEFAFLKFLNNSTLAKEILPTKIEEFRIIKRVIGTPDDIVDLIDGEVYLNGDKLEEIYIKDEMSTFERSIEFPITLGEDEYIVFGDNRLGSLDSRNPEVGIISRDDIKGKAVLRIWPLNKLGKID